jgi:hypothetical protein
MTRGYFGYLAGKADMTQDYGKETELEVQDATMPTRDKLMEKKPEPLILTTDPEDVMWTSLMFAVVVSGLAFLATYAI